MKRYEALTQCPICRSRATRPQQPSLPQRSWGKRGHPLSTPGPGSPFSHGVSSLLSHLHQVRALGLALCTSTRCLHTLGKLSHQSPSDATGLALLPLGDVCSRMCQQSYMPSLYLHVPSFLYFCPYSLLCAHTHMGMCIQHGCVEVRGQLCRVSSLLPPYTGSHPPRRWRMWTQPRGTNWCSR